jgi:A/G-specific adenine glycosylase
VTARPPGAAGAGDPAGLVVELAAWFGASGRDLPWRRTRDPWAILVSELMLQQTGVARVEPRFRRFLERFPTPAACAAAPAGAVVEEWQGLGYNRRAVNLHRCAVACVEAHGGVLPATLDELLALPGVGPYTARAVLAFAHEEPVACMDVNVTRSLSRLTGAAIDQAVADELAVVAADHAPGGAWAWNQAVMELGAVACRPAPRCASCPVAVRCAWRGGDGVVGADPWVRARPQSRFEGSDRQGRGRLVDALRRGAVAAADVPAAMGWPDDVERAERVAATVLADGLAVVDPRTATWHLP